MFSSETRLNYSFVPELVLGLYSPPPRSAIADNLFASYHGWNAIKRDKFVGRLSAKELTIFGAPTKHAEMPGSTADTLPLVDALPLRGVPFHFCGPLPPQPECREKATGS